MATNFHKELNHYLRNQNRQAAVNMLLTELGNVLVTNRADFIEMLKNGSVLVSSNDSDAALIENFVENAHGNKKLLLGAALLLNHKNKVTNFDGASEISDAGVKNTYRVFMSGFNGTDEQEEQSNFLPLLAAGKSILSKFGQKNNQKNEAGNAMATAALQRQQALQAEAEKQKKRSKKKINALIIGAGVVVSLTIVGVVIYKIKKSR